MRHVGLFVFVSDSKRPTTVIYRQSPGSLSGRATCFTHPGRFVQFEGFKDHMDEIFIVAWLIYRYDGWRQDFLTTDKICRQHYKIIRIKLRTSSNIDNQVYSVSSSARNLFTCLWFLAYMRCPDFSQSFLREVSWSSPLLSKRRPEKSARTNDSQGTSQGVETSCIENTVVVRMYWCLSRMHDQFPVRKDERCAYLPLPVHPS